MELHCRKGKVGTWREELSPAHIEIFRDRYERELALLGYDLGDEEQLVSRPRTAVALDRIATSPTPVAETEQQLETLENEIARRIEEIATVDAQLEAASQELGHRRVGLQKTLAHADALEHVVFAVERERDAVKGILASRDREIGSLRSLFEAKQRELDSITSVTESRERALETANEMIVARRREIETLQALLTSRGGEVESAQTLLAGKAGEVDLATGPRL